MLDIQYSDLEPHLDPGIAPAVRILMEGGIETFESCQGGCGHAYPEPTIRFFGQRDEGFRALARAQQYGLIVRSLRRVWSVTDGEPTGPHWEIVFIPGLFANLRHRAVVEAAADRAVYPERCMDLSHHVRRAHRTSRSA